jgi:transcriptional regulator with XRE-family HTH domain
MTEQDAALNRAMGGRLRAARQARGLSLSELEALTGGQFRKGRISNYEQGLRRMTVETAQALAEVLGNVSAAHLLCVEAGAGGLLTPDERRLLRSFRAADAERRRLILGCAASVSPPTPDSP